MKKPGWIYARWSRRTVIIGTVSTVFTVLLLLVFQSDSEKVTPKLDSRIVQQLESSDPAVRLKAVRNLRTANLPNSPQLLVARLKDSNEDVRFAAAEEIARLRDRSIIEEVVAIYNSGSNRAAAVALAAIAGINEQATVFDMVNSTDPIIRRSGVEALANVSGREKIPPFLRDADETVRVAAARAIKKSFPDSEAISIFSQVLEQDNYELKKVAVFGLSMYQQARDALMKALKDNDERIRLQALYALAQFPNVNEALIIAKSDSSEVLQKAALEIERSQSKGITRRVQ